MKLTQAEILETCAEMGMDAWVLSRAEAYREAKVEAELLREGPWVDAVLDARADSVVLRLGPLRLEPVDSERCSAKMTLEFAPVYGWSAGHCSEQMAAQMERLAAQLPGLIAKLRGVPDER